MAAERPQDSAAPAEGVLEISEKGFGFLRSSRNNFLPREGDVFVPRELIDKYRLREGLLLGGPTAPPRKGNNGPRLLAVERVDGGDPQRLRDTHRFENLTSIDPVERIKFETPGGPVTMRVIDLMAPIGKGQRGLIVASPKTGKTTLLKQMAAGIEANHPEIEVFVVLIDERPEEVTDFRRSVKGHVVASSADADIEHHVRVAKMVLEVARRRVEFGHDVAIFLDSITRLGRASNRNTRSSGRTLSGGVDARALEFPRKFFGAARKIEEGGSLTIMGTALVDTGSQMDQVIFEEFKGTGNSEIVLSREIAERRLWPAMDILKSGTRKEEKILKPDELEKVIGIRRLLAGQPPLRAIEALIKKLEQYKSNADFLASI